MIKDLNLEEIKKMLLIALKNDSYTAKCFICILLKEYNITLREEKLLKEINKELNRCNIKEAEKLINNL